MLKNTVLAERQAFALRLCVGIAVGFILAWLNHLHAHDAKPLPWQAVAFTTLGLSAFIWWAGAGPMRRVSLIVWGIIITAVIAALAWHSAAKGAADEMFAFTAGRTGMLILPLLFILHELVSSADQSGKVVAPYSTYFDQAWKRGVQLGLSLLFTGLFWAILWLGATLLKFIGFHWFERLLGHDWFAMPALGAAMACAVQLGDVQDKLLTNVRALVLNVLSWLLPVIAVIGLLFLGSLCISGLEPLWKTKAASLTLLSGCVIFVLLINAAYQQGDGERKVHVVMQWAARLAAFLLLAFAILAACGVWLRVEQYGLTPERVLAASGVIIALLFGVGYVVAAVLPGRWLRAVETVNVAMAFIEVGIFLALLTPVADPDRLGVDDQVARLQSGRTAAEKFDWRELRFETGRYGTRALDQLAKTGTTADIRADAAKAKALGDDDRWDKRPLTPKIVDLGKIKVIYPAGGQLPANLNAQAFDNDSAPDCLTNPDLTCTAAVIDMDGDGVAEVILAERPTSDVAGASIAAVTFDKGKWSQVTSIGTYLSAEQIKAFNAGKITLRPHRWSELEVEGDDTSRVRSERWIATSGPSPAH